MFYENICYMTGVLIYSMEKAIKLVISVDIMGNSSYRTYLEKLLKDSSYED